MLKVLRALKSAEVSVHVSFCVESIEGGMLKGQSGQSIKVDEVLWCTGGTAPAFIQNSGIRTTNGFADVDRTFRVMGTGQSIFAAGLEYP